MKSTANLLTVVMDGIRDANMLYDYAETAEMEGVDALHDWFKKKADARAERTAEEWRDAKAVLKLDEQADEMSGCLKAHVEREMSYLRAKAK